MAVQIRLPRNRDWDGDSRASDFLGDVLRRRGWGNRRWGGICLVGFSLLLQGALEHRLDLQGRGPAFVPHVSQALTELKRGNSGIGYPQGNHLADPCGWGQVSKERAQAEPFTASPHSSGGRGAGGWDGRTSGQGIYGLTAVIVTSSDIHWTLIICQALFYYLIYTSIWCSQLPYEIEMLFYYLHFTNEESETQRS